MRDLLIIGAGGHGRVVAEAAELQGIWDSIMFLDDRTDTDMVLGHRIIGKMDEYKLFTNKYKYVIVCIGSNDKRLQLIQNLLKVGYIVPIIVHPRASVSKYCHIGEGSVILAGVVINTNSSIDKGCIININSCIDHDCIVEDGVHVCSGAVVRSGCRIGKLSYIGAGICIKSETILEERSVIRESEILQRV